MLQTILLDLLTNSTSVSEVSDARRVYRARQRRLADALAAHDVHVPVADGVNTWLEVRDERSAVVQLAAAGIRVAAGTPFLATSGGNFIRVTAGFVRGDFDAVAAQLAAAVRA
jgi:DNA-binding transcriptional MocR family regulator